MAEKPAARRRLPTPVELLALVWRWGARIGKEVLRRGYALVLMLLILWLSGRAIAYLIDSLVVPLRAPPQIIGVPKRLDESLLHGRRPDWVGLSAVENPRSPLAHYHRFDTWLQTDSFNDCTRGGCHAPLPHSKRKEVRAFLNMHATSIHCGVCHIAVDATPLPLTWYDVRRGAASAAPGLLRAYAWLDAHPRGMDAASYDEADQRELSGLLFAAARDADDDPSIRYLGDHLAAVRAGSAAFGALVEAARETVSRSMRGAYGAKLAVKDPATGRPLLKQSGTEDAVRAFLREGGESGPERREELLHAVHPDRRTEALHCTTCHRDSGSLIDFAGLGYPAARIRTLLDPAIFQMIEHINEGRPFYIPTLTAPPSTAPRSTAPHPLDP
jgi:hypothetical protein